MSRLYVVATPIGNLNDMTFRAIEILKNSDIILCEDTRTSQVLLNHYEIFSKLEAYHKFNENSKSESIIDKMLDEDLTVSIITDAGTPCISDPGTYIVQKARQNNIDVFVVPGASAVISSLSVSGLNFKEFAFLGFFPRESKEQKTFLTQIEDSFIDTFVIYESPKRIIDTLKCLKNVFSDLMVVCCNDLTKKFERYYYGDIDSVLEQLEQNDNAELGEYVVCIQKKIKEKEKYDISLEALLCDDIVKNGGTIKDAINRLKKTYPKNDLYEASLNLKKLEIFKH